MGVCGYDDNNNNPDGEGCEEGGTALLLQATRQSTMRRESLRHTTCRVEDYRSVVRFHMSCVTLVTIALYPHRL